MFEMNEKFEDFFNNCEFKSENHQCKSGHQATSVCVEKKCQNSCFICENDKCKECSTNHQSCNLKFSIDMFAKAVNKNL